MKNTVREKRWLENLSKYSHFFSIRLYYEYEIWLFKCFNLICAMVAFYKLWVINLVWGAFIITSLRDSVIRLVYLENSSQYIFFKYNR